jgi:aldehyde:ferredoxin oxidoreductase
VSADSAMTFGYHGRMLHIDLGERRVWTEEPDENVWRRYAGGGLLATWLLMRDTSSGLDPFDPRSPLIFTSSVIAGQPYAGLARFTVSAKSPLTGGIGETRCEGPWGWALKGSGADTLVFHGASAHPVAVEVRAGTVRFHEASDLWGMPVSVTTDALEARLGADISVAAIGPAGENLVRFASIVAGRYFQAARMGMGAVAGAKRLKAVVLHGDDHPPVADPERCAAITADYAARMRENDLTRWQLEPPGFGVWIHNIGEDSALATRNYRESQFAGAGAYEPEKFMPFYRGVAVCPGCPNDCIKIFAGGPGSILASPEGGLHQEIAGAMGANLGVDDLEAMLMANVLCNDLGLDPVSLGYTLSMAMECMLEGLLPAGTVPAFGDSPGILAAIGDVATRTGFGDVLAEGSRRAAESIGPAAAHFALHVKGLEMTPFEPRTQTNLALGFAVAPIGPRYDICEHDWDYDPRMGWGHTLEGSRTLGILERVAMDEISPAKVRNFKALSTLWSAADALDYCIFAIAPTRVLTLTAMTDLLAAVTGWETSSWEIMRWGERRWHLMRAYNLREGLTGAADTLPDRFFDEPIREGRWTGTRLDRVQFAAAIEVFYRMMGWDDAGCPRYETLLDHGLEWIVDDGHLARV